MEEVIWSELIQRIRDWVRAWRYAVLHGGNRPPTEDTFVIDLMNEYELKKKDLT